MAVSVVGDAASRRDPTGTGDLRAAYWRDMRKRFALLTVALQRAIVGQDALGLGPTAQITASPRADRVQAFQAWLNETSNHIVLGRSAEWMRPYLQESIERAVARADALTGKVSHVQRDRTHVDVMLALASAEVSGILAAFVQQATRATAHALLVNQRAAKLAAQVKRAARAAAARAKIVTQHVTVKAFGHATIESFKSAGVERVGTIPETVPVAAPSLSGGGLASGELPPVARPTPSSTVAKVAKGSVGVAALLPFVPYAKKKAAELEARGSARRARKAGLAAVTFAQIETAGDDKVCDDCESISKNGPYPIRQAAGMLPLHPHCRCIYTPL